MTTKGPQEQSAFPPRVWLSKFAAENIALGVRECTAFSERKFTYDPKSAVQYLSNKESEAIVEQRVKEAVERTIRACTNAARATTSDGGEGEKE